MTGVLLAALAWHPSTPLGIGALAVLWLLPIAWALCPSRGCASLFIGAYFLVVGRDIPAAIAQFTNMPFLWAVALVILHALVMCIVWGVAWSGKPIRRTVGLGVVLLLTNTPPLVAIGFASPLLAAGWLFPSTGVWGLVLTFVSWCLAFACMSAMQSWWRYRAQYQRYQRRTMWHWAARWPLAVAAGLPTMLVVLLAVAIRTNLAFPYPAPVLGWQGVSTQLARYPLESLDAQYTRQTVLLDMARTAMESANVVVLPEEVGGVWQARMAWLWHGLTRAQPQKTLVVGFDVLDRPALFSNRALVLQAGKVVDSVAARIPVPIGSWRPWAQPHAPMRWFDDGLLTIQNTPVAVIFCYEELLLWPWLVSAVHAPPSTPPVALVMVNHWFAPTRSSIDDSQMRSSQAWARLWGWPVVRVVNKGPVASQ